MSEPTTCWNCGNPVSSTSLMCPYCRCTPTLGSTLLVHGGPWGWIIYFGGVFLFLVFCCCGLPLGFLSCVGWSAKNEEDWFTQHERQEENNAWKMGVEKLSKAREEWEDRRYEWRRRNHDPQGDKLEQWKKENPEPEMKIKKYEKWQEEYREWRKKYNAWNKMNLQNHKYSEEAGKWEKENPVPSVFEENTK